MGFSSLADYRAHTRSFKSRGIVGCLVLIPAATALLCSKPNVRVGSLLDWSCHSAVWGFL